MNALPPAAFRVDGRWDVPSEGVLARLVAEGAPFAHSAPPSSRQRIVETFVDTDDGALAAKGISCTLRASDAGTHQLEVARMVDRGGEVLVERVTSDALGPVRERLIRGSSRAVEELRRHVDLGLLRPQLQLQIARRSQLATSRHWWRRATFGFAYDTITLRTAGLEGSFREVSMQEVARGRPSAQDVADALSERFALRSVSMDRRARAEDLRAALERDAAARRVGRGRNVALLAIDAGRIAGVRDGMGWRLPMLEGSGETAGRHLLRLTLGTALGDLHLVTRTEARDGAGELELWCCTRMDHGRRSGGNQAVAWIPVAEMLEHIARREGIDRVMLSTLAALTGREARAPLVLRGAAGRSGMHGAKDHEPAVRMLDPELSLLRFNERVLHLAESDATPVAERLRYVAIVASNLDEFFAVRVGRLKYRIERAVDGSHAAPPTRRLERIARHADTLAMRLAECAARVVAAFAGAATVIDAHAELTADEHHFLRDHFLSAILPALTPRHLAATEGHTLPLIPDRALALAIVVRNRRGGVRRVVQIALPATLPRFVALPDHGRFVTIEHAVRRHLGLVFPGCHVEGSTLFRLTRHANVAVDEGGDVDGVQLMDEQTRLRERQPVVRIEVEQGTSHEIRQLLLKELSFEPGARPGVLRAGDVREVPGLLDVSSLSQLAAFAPPALAPPALAPRALAARALAAPALSFPPFRPRAVLAGIPSLWDAIRAQDLFLHHPFDDFATSVVRFVREAADDPEVIAMKMTLYRTGACSPIVESLCRAAECGKDVTVYVELKARFDEERNVLSTRRLQGAGVHVIHGLPGCKNHAKFALVVRREGGVLRRYAHIGTGNYNTATSGSYTDFGLLTARTAVTDDLSSLFTTFTAGGSRAALSPASCLVAPHALHRGLLARIGREARHAREGREARIRIKVNGLADREVIRALYDASQAGVEIDLVVRGICTLIPGVPGMSETITVRSIVGRFLEHARCFAFENSGCPEWWIGSADLRPRNLHRRVEVLVPVTVPAQCARLDALFAAELSDPTAWRLTSDGTYEPPAVSAFESATSAQRLAAVAPVGEHGVS